MDSRAWGLEPSVPSTPTCEPNAIVAGDSATWQRSIPDYPADQGWVLHYRLLSSGQTPITIDGTASGPDHLIQVPAATTGAWEAADYNWSAYVTNGTDRHTLGAGIITIKPDPTQQAEAFDPRSEAQKILAQVKAALAAEASTPLSEYRIGDKTFKRDPGLRDQLLEMEAVYQRRVAREVGRLVGGGIGIVGATFTQDFGSPWNGLG